MTVAHGSSTENSAFGSDPKNAVDDTKVKPVEVAVVQRCSETWIVLFALAPTQGSIRQPAEILIAGVVGVKANLWCMNSRYGVVAMASSTDVRLWCYYYRGCSTGDRNYVARDEKMLQRFRITFAAHAPKTTESLKIGVISALDDR